VAFPETAGLAGSLYRHAAVCVLPSKNTSTIKVLRRPVESAQYCDGGTGGTGTFRLDAGCWTGYQPAFQVKAL
jgi:hypothetical protein